MICELFTYVIHKNRAVHHKLPFNANSSDFTEELAWKKWLKKWLSCEPSEMLGSFWVMTAFVFWRDGLLCLTIDNQLIAYSISYKAHQDTNYMVRRTIILSAIYAIGWAKLNVDESTVKGKKKKTLELFISWNVRFYPLIYRQYVSVQTVDLLLLMFLLVFNSLSYVVSLWFLETLSLTYLSFLLLWKALGCHYTHWANTYWKLISQAQFKEDSKWAK